MTGADAAETESKAICVSGVATGGGVPGMTREPRRTTDTEYTVYAGTAEEVLKQSSFKTY